MRLRTIQPFVILVLIYFCIPAKADEPELQGLIVTKEVAITLAFVEDVCLRFDGTEYYITIALNKRGKDLFTKAFKNIGDKKMALVFGDSVLADPLPIRTETINEILVKFDDARPALELLKHFSR